MKEQANISLLKPKSCEKMFANDSYLDETQDTECKRIIINFTSELKVFTEDRKK